MEPFFFLAWSVHRFAGGAGKWSVWKETCVPIFKKILKRNMQQWLDMMVFTQFIGLKYKGNFWQIQEKIPHFRLPSVAQTLKRTVHCFLSRRCKEGVIKTTWAVIVRKYWENQLDTEKRPSKCRLNENRVHVWSECLRHKRNYIINAILKAQLRLYKMLWFCQHLEPFDKTTFAHLMHHFKSAFF